MRTMQATSTASRILLNLHLHNSPIVPGRVSAYDESSALRTGPCVFTAGASCSRLTKHSIFQAAYSATCVMDDCRGIVDECASTARSHEGTGFTLPPQLPQGARAASCLQYSWNLVIRPPLVSTIARDCCLYSLLLRKPVPGQVELHDHSAALLAVTGVLCFGTFYCESRKGIAQTREEGRPSDDVALLGLSPAAKIGTSGSDDDMPPPILPNLGHVPGCPHCLTTLAQAPTAAGRCHMRCFYRHWGPRPHCKNPTCAGCHLGDGGHVSFNRTARKRSIAIKDTPQTAGSVSVRGLRSSK
jgi:hypothetical protein